MTTTELADMLAEVLGRVAYGGSRYTVTRHGKPLAVIVSVEDAEHLTRVA